LDSHGLNNLVTKGMTIHVKIPTISVAVMNNLNGALSSFKNQPVAKYRNRLVGNTPHKVANAIFHLGGAVVDLNQASSPVNSR
jgi:hypothetical protein